MDDYVFLADWTYEFLSTEDEIKEVHEILRTKWRRKKRSPLKFVEAYSRCKCAVRLNYSGICEDPDMYSQPLKTAVLELKTFLESLEKEYSECVPLALAQRKKNEYWRDIYDPPPRPWRG